MFRFLHSVSVGVPKIFAYFSCFLYELSVLKRVFKQLKIEEDHQLRQRRIFPDVATCGVLPSGEGICGQKKRNRARATKRLPLLRFPANPFGADSLSPQQDGAWSLDWKYSSPHRSHNTGFAKIFGEAFVPKGQKSSMSI
ncbi:hypothetical protein LOY85_07635 [Brevibacillus brevis]|uniref:hypothetical protein n=1 Tax=Brevibacillus brevis TaxID=1393 RepID=UPI001F30EC62|nr:hypothetical protein [Brevibacillus brevis]UIO44018.1 hypothetical protein LOY85_07635 [Brevibacillus brevis]